MEKVESKSIKISRPNYKRIIKYGKFGDSINDVITKILDKLDKK